MLDVLSRLFRRLSSGKLRQYDAPEYSVHQYSVHQYSVHQYSVHQYSVHPPGLTFLPEVTAGRWVEDGLSSTFASVGALVPDGFEGYARVLHPALNEASQLVKWSTVAEWSGRVYHPLMSFEGIGTPTVGRGAGSPPWSDDPGHGRMDEDVAAELSALLAQFTGTPEECYFGVWEGYGQYSGGSAILTSDGRSRRLSTPGDIRRAQRVKGVGRNYLLYAGRLEQIAGFYHKFPPRPPNIWWPADHAWLVATDIDLDSTYVGGTLECIDAILASKALEAVPAHRAASVAITADDINLSDRS